MDENNDEKLDLDSPQREIQQNMDLAHIFVKIVVSRNDYLERDQKSEIAPTEDIDKVQNYSKAPKYTQLYARKGNTTKLIPNYSKSSTHTLVYTKKGNGRMRDSNIEKKYILIK